MNNEKLKVLLINDMVLFPGCEIRTEFETHKDKQLLSLLDTNDNKEIIAVNPLVDDEVIDVTELPSIGVIAELKLKLDVPNGKTRILLRGIKRVRITSYHDDNNQYEANYEEIIKEKNSKEDVYSNLLIKSLEKYISLVPYMSNAVMSQIKDYNTLDKLCDLIGSYLPVSYELKKRYIIETDPIKRVKLLIEDMNEDLKLIELERKIEGEVIKELDDSQKEFFLREKIKVIQKELGDVNTKEDEVTNFKNKLSKLKCNPKVKNKIKKEINRYEVTNSNSPELGMIREYLDWMLNLPWSRVTKDENSLIEVERVLDSTHYGLDDVKERILEYLAVKQNTNNLRSPILCLVGPPGVGKTSLALSIAKSLNRKTAKISVGGINDEAEIIGHRRTYVGASPGRIIQGIRRAGTANPVFIIDEIDKMRKDIKGDPASSLLEVLDPEQNNKFSDHYIEEDFDLSNVMFIATANYIDQIPYELLDRLEIIEVSSYTEYEKLDIAKKYLIPKELEEHGLTPIEVSFNEDAIMTLIRHYTKEAGVRELERIIATLFRKIVKSFLLNKTIASYTIDNKLIEQFLGKKKYRYLETEKTLDIGVVNGMAYTAFGGDILPIEVTLYHGKGNLILTGSLGDVMQESARIALSYIKANTKQYEIAANTLEENDIHIHVPEGAVPKDGPSAGITLVTALISLLTNKKVSSKISMTGEVTLRGKVLAIGGLREKVIGAHRAGINKIIIPKENEIDLDEIPKDLKKDINFIYVENYKDIYDAVFKS